MCQEGQFAIENISFYDDAKLGTELTAEADWKRRGLYIGPEVICLMHILLKKKKIDVFFTSSLYSLILWTLLCKMNLKSSSMREVSTLL